MYFIITMRKLVYELFLKHPREIGLTYSEHAKRSVGFSLELAVCSLKALCHAVIPHTFVDSTTKLNESLSKQLEKGKWGKGEVGERECN
jgi:hypothetical protein